MLLEILFLIYNSRSIHTTRHTLLPVSIYIVFFKVSNGTWGPIVRVAVVIHITSAAFSMERNAITVATVLVCAIFSPSTYSVRLLPNKIMKHSEIVAQLMCQRLQRRNCRDYTNCICLYYNW